MTDAESARQYLVSVGAGVLQIAMEQNDVVTRLLDRAMVITMCAELPDDMVVRIRCFPNVFNLRA